MEELTNRGVARDGKVFLASDQLVLDELTKYEDITEEVAIGNVLAVYNRGLEAKYGNPLPEMVEITVTEKNKADYPVDFEQVEVGATVAVPFGKLALYY